MARVLYSDLDGTMLGPRGCFFRAAGGATTVEPARALTELHDAGVQLVLVSGRTRAQLQEASWIFGADGYVAELGALVGWGSQVEVLPSQAPPGQVGCPADVLEAFLDHFAGRIELHSPWDVGHEVDVLLRGNVGDASSWLADNGVGWLELVDNGVLKPTAEWLGGDPLHVYHLLPKGISKDRAVAWDLARRGLTADDAVAVGDSRADLAMASVVGRMFVVANGVPHLADVLPDVPNAVACTGELGAGWVEAARWAAGS